MDRLEKIKTKEYVRTNEGNIFQITQVIIHKKYTLIETDNFGTISESVLKEIMQEKSFDIRNLLKEGDIVIYNLKNLGHLKIGITKKYKDTRSGEEYLILGGYKLDNITVSRILTKQEFNTHCYRLED